MVSNLPIDALASVVDFLGEKFKISMKLTCKNFKTAVEHFTESEIFRQPSSPTSRGLVGNGGSLTRVSSTLGDTATNVGAMMRRLQSLQEGSGRSVNRPL